MPRNRAPVIYIVSDGTGNTATRVLRAAAVQFEGQRYRLVRRVGVRGEKHVVRAVERAAQDEAVIFYTLVGEATRRAMLSAAGRLLVPTVDVLGAAFTALDELFRRKHGAIPGLLEKKEHDRVRRTEAIEYALRHDDGQRLRELSSADVVLVGVSRSSKSSTCFYLAYRGVKAANVPLLPGIPPPDEVLRLPQEKVIGLRVNLSRLMTVREARATVLGIEHDDPYVDRRAVGREIVEANRTMEKCGWRSLDVSYLAVEEIAREVMSLRGFRERPW